MLSIAWFTMLKYIRNPIILLFFVLAPLLMTSVTISLGEASAGAGTALVERTGILLEDNGPSVQKLEGLLNEAVAAGNLQIEKITSMDAGLKKVRNGSLDSLVHVQGGKIVVYSSKSASGVSVLTDRFLNQTAVEQLVGKKDSPFKLPKKDDSTSFNRLDTDSDRPSVGNGTAVATLLIFLFYTAVVSSNSIISEMNRKTDLRHKVSPVGFLRYVFGKFIGNTFIVYLVSVFLMLVLHFLYDIPLEGNLAVVFAAFLFFVILANGVGNLLAGLIKNVFICALTTFAVNFLLICPVMVYENPTESNVFFDLCMEVSPHVYAYEAIVGTIYGNAAYTPLSSLAVLAVTTIAVVAVSLPLVRRRYR